MNLGVGLSQAGKKVLLVDCDPQGSLSICLGETQPDSIRITLGNLLSRILADLPYEVDEGVIQTKEGVDLLPGNIELSGVEVSLVNAMSRESILKQYLRSQQAIYDYILIDCQPSLGMLPINALVAADSVLIPVQAEYLPVKGLEQLIRTVSKVKKQLNPKLEIEGILITMVNERTNIAKDIIAEIERFYGLKIKIFDSKIPHSVRAKESNIEGKSIYSYDPKGKIANAYSKLTREVLNGEKQRQKNRTDISR